MFFLSLIEDIISLSPSQFHLDTHESLSMLIQNKYIDKVIPNIGLVVGLYDIVKIKEGIVRRGDGSVKYKVDIRLVVFKPFKGEVLDGIISHSHSSGLKVSLGFFNDVEIHEAHLRDPKGYNEMDHLWYWDYSGHKLYYDLDLPIRFRVIDIQFPNLKDVPVKKKTEYIPPMIVLGSVIDVGLGIKDWWK